MPETATLTLADFLLARIAEDEAAAREARRDELAYSSRPSYAKLGFTAGDLAQRFDPARVLAECDAKRRIVERLTRAADLAWSGSYAVRDDARASLADLALPYADHSDFQDDWRP